MDDLFRYIDSHADAFVHDLQRLCRQPSISAQGIGLEECAALLVAQMQAKGIPARTEPVSGAPPLVVAEIPGDSARTLLIYDHYDVQPVDPVGEWDSDPFAAEIRDGRLYARGAQDTKGNIMARAAAIETWLRVRGRLPVTVKFLIEGEEEVGSPHFRPFVEANKELLKADGATIEGGDHLHDGTPKIELGCKGTLYVDMTCRTANVDQHSMYAPIAPNPSWRLIHALNTLRNKDGKVTIPGWYEDARRPSARELRYLKASGFKAQSLKEFWGARELLGGDNDFEILRRLIYWPTCTICGFISGYTGQGTKTVNPAVARAKIDFRLVPNMKVEKQLLKLKDHLKAKGFEDIQLEYADSLEASAIPMNARVVKAAVKGSIDAVGREPEIWPWSAGASANGFFNEIVGAPSISGPGVSYDGSNYHAPNENIRISDFVMGAKHMAAMIGRF